MRPSGVTPLASVKTSAAPPTARDPRCTKCQSFENPSTLEYWHIGETMIRLASVSERSGSGSKRCGIPLDYVEGAQEVDVAESFVFTLRRQCPSRGGRVVGAAQ